MVKSGVKPITLPGNFEMLASIRAHSNCIHVVFAANYSVQDKHDIWINVSNRASTASSLYTICSPFEKPPTQKTPGITRAMFSQMCSRQELDGEVIMA